MWLVATLWEHSSRTKLLGSTLYNSPGYRSWYPHGTIFPENFWHQLGWVCERFSLHVLPRIIPFNLVLHLVSPFRLHFLYNEVPFGAGGSCIFLLCCHFSLPAKYIFNSGTSICRGHEGQCYFCFSHEVVLLPCGFMNTKNGWESMPSARVRWGTDISWQWSAVSEP